MSADLFAEFNSLSDDPSPARQSPLDAHSDQPRPHPSRGWSQDLVGFGQSSNEPTPDSQAAHAWPSFQPQTSNQSLWPHSAAPSALPQHAAPDDDDGWGDFEVAESEAPSTNHVSPHLVSKAQEPRPTQRVVRVPTIDLMTNNLVDVGRPTPSHTAPLWSQHQTKSDPRRQVHEVPSDPNVLFDADDFALQGGDEDDEDGDDFGDFEAVAQPPSQRKPALASTSSMSPSLDLLGLDEPPVPFHPEEARQHSRGVPSASSAIGAISSNHATARKSPPVQSRTAFADPPATKPAGFGSSKRAEVDLPVTAWPSNANKPVVQETENEDEWAAWDDAPTDHNSTKTAVNNKEQPDSWDWDHAEGSEPPAAEAEHSGPPPVNVPPPSVILSAFPELFLSGNSLFTPVAGQSASIKQQILSDSKAVQFLQGYILLGTTAARVIAGRKHRWHRDKILVKSMSISAAGSKGMKLAGVDKTQSAREDREAADVAAAWRDHVGRLRSAVAIANTSGKVSLKVPELSESMQIQTAKLVPTAPKPCIICGLRREERVTKVDYDVEDSFGEWWVEHWGHRACRNFWIEHEQRLRQR